MFDKNLDPTFQHACQNLMFSPIYFKSFTSVNFRTSFSNLRRFVLQIVFFSPFFYRSNFKHLKLHLYFILMHFSMIFFEKPKLFKQHFRLKSGQDLSETIFFGNFWIPFRQTHSFAAKCLTTCETIFLSSLRLKCLFHTMCVCFGVVADVFVTDLAQSN